jgi:hypothetical protein
MMKGKQYTRCPKCKKGLAEYFGMTNNYIILCCSECGHQWLEPIPSPDQLGDWPSAVRYGSDL